MKPLIVSPFLRSALAFLVTGVSFTALADPFPYWLFDNKLTEDVDPAQPGSEFGDSTAISGDYALVAAKEENLTTDDEGVVYVFDLTNGTVVRKLYSSDLAADDEFGSDVAVDGYNTVIGADAKNSSTGSAYLFNFITGAELFTLTPSVTQLGAEFGFAVDILGDYAIIGAPFEDGGGTEEGVAYVFDVTTGAEVYRLTASDAEDFDGFGYAVALTDTYAFVGAPYRDESGTDNGKVYVFDLSDGSQVGTLTPSMTNDEAYFGFSLSADGNYVVSGSPDENGDGTDRGAAYLFDTATMMETFRLISPDPENGAWFGEDVGIAGDAVIVGSPLANGNGADQGAAYVFNTATGELVDELLATDGEDDDRFGHEVAISEDFATVGLNAESIVGAAYVFEGVSVTPSQIALKALYQKKAKKFKKKARTAKKKGQTAKAKRLFAKARKFSRLAATVY